MKHDRITLAHGNGGEVSHRFIQKNFLEVFEKHGVLYPSGDSSSDAVLIHEAVSGLVLSTDSFVIHPLFFPGGDIGSLSVHGTVNDITVRGATPLYLTLGMIIEEGFPFSELNRIVESMALAAKKVGVQMVAGDTKVVEKGSADGLFINTAGVGALKENAPSGLDHVIPGDQVLVSGSVGDHGMALYALREGMEFQSSLKSDSAWIGDLVEIALEEGENEDGSSDVRIMRDPTRGGLATTLNEFSRGRSWGLQVQEEMIPVKDSVRGMCELLGFDPLHVANEGKVVLIATKQSAQRILERWSRHPSGKDASIIGEVTDRMPGRVILETEIGGERILDMLTGDMLPRIC